jgi:8-oxo-dGTP pyrophosphatase MutT (NUDIX family)
MTPRLGRKLASAEERARAAAVLDGSYTPTVPRPAVSVILAREAAGALEIFLLWRAPTMTFLPGRLVFPGGSVDKRDAGNDALPDVAVIAGQLGVPPEEARTKVITGVRETFEETGVLLARHRLTGAAFEIDADVLESERARTLDRNTTVADVLDRFDLAVHADDLKPWARWVTPTVSPIRFDVTFFLAALPPGQVARHISTEATEAAWWKPAAALAASKTGEVQLATPQRMLLTELAGLHTLGDAFGSARSLMSVCPEPALVDGDYYLVFPDGVPVPGQ